MKFILANMKNQEQELRQLTEAINNLVDAVNRNSKIKMITIERNEMDQNIATQMIVSSAMNTNNKIE